MMREKVYKEFVETTFSSVETVTRAKQFVETYVFHFFNGVRFVLNKLQNDGGYPIDFAIMHLNQFLPTTSDQILSRLLYNKDCYDAQKQFKGYDLGFTTILDQNQDNFTKHHDDMVVYSDFYRNYSINSYYKKQALKFLLGKLNHDEAELDQSTLMSSSTLVGTLEIDGYNMREMKFTKGIATE